MIIISFTLRQLLRKALSPRQQRSFALDNQLFLHILNSLKILLEFNFLSVTTKNWFYESRVRLLLIIQTVSLGLALKCMRFFIIGLKHLDLHFTWEL
jgi:hypothetical protein